MSKTSIEHIAVTVVYAQVDTYFEKVLRVPLGTIVGEAITLSEIYLKYSEISSTNRIGIYGTEVDKDHVLADGDRIEIYRNLIADPKEVRRKRTITRKKNSS